MQQLHEKKVFCAVAVLTARAKISMGFGASINGIHCRNIVQILCFSWCNTHRIMHSYFSGCSSISVGLSYPSTIPDHRFTASSFYDYPRYRPSNGRLLSARAWGPKTASSGNWLQIDLGSLVYVCAVATQGGGKMIAEFVERYKISVSLDNVYWNYYQENNIDKVNTRGTHRKNISSSICIAIIVPYTFYDRIFHPHRFRPFPNPAFLSEAKKSLMVTIKLGRRECIEFNKWIRGKRKHRVKKL